MLVFFLSLAFRLNGRRCSIYMHCIFCLQFSDCVPFPTVGSLLETYLIMGACAGLLYTLAATRNLFTYPIIGLITIKFFNANFADEKEKKEKKRKKKCDIIITIIVCAPSCTHAALSLQERPVLLQPLPLPAAFPLLLMSCSDHTLMKTSKNILLLLPFHKIEQASCPPPTSSCSCPRTPPKNPSGRHSCRQMQMRCRKDRGVRGEERKERGLRVGGRKQRAAAA
jgi:hypothetical protein